jgi:formate dehydrogenase major subunit
MTEMQTGVPAEELRAAARLYATGGNGAIYYGLGVTEHSQGSTTVMGIANLAMLTGNIGRDGVGVNPLRGQNNVQGSCDMGSFPHELPGYRHVKNADVRAIFENAWGVEIDPEPGLRIPNMLDAAVAGPSRGSIARARISCSRTPTPSMSPPVSPRWNASSSTTCS